MSRRLDQAEAELCRSWIANRRQLERIITQMEQISTAAGELILGYAGASNPARTAKR